MTTASSRVNGSAARRASIVLFIVTVLVPTAAPAAQQVLYVKSDAAGAGDGSSWASAYADLQDALDYARAHVAKGLFEVWVAAGVYKPDRGTGDRWASFDLLSNVALYGGFAGWETLRHQRDPAGNETILSGDLLGNDDPDFIPESTCCHPTNDPGCDDPACEQIVCDWQSVCCDTWDVGCDWIAARFCCDLCRPDRCDNSYSVLTAIETDESAMVDGFTVCGGEANRRSQPGDDVDRPQEGGGLYALRSNFTLKNCIFADNAGVWGSAVSSFSGEPTISHSTFTHNFSYIGSAALNVGWNEASVSYCTFIANFGAGLSTASSQPIIGCRFIGNSPGRGLSLFAGAPNIIGCTFTRNAGGMYSAGFPQLFNCSFFGNAAPSCGGAIYSGWNIILLNCLFVGNTAGGGISNPELPPSPGWAGAVDHGYGYGLVLNCVFVGNSAGRLGGMWASGNTTIAHSIFWANFDDEGSGEEAQLDYGLYERPVVRYNSIQGWTGTLEGPGNIDVEPRFLDADGPDGVPGTEDDNLRLAMESPLINAGDPDPPLLQRYDGDGHFRTLYGRVDIGAYEFGIGDYDWDLVCDLGDFAAWESCMTGPDSDTYDDGCRAFDFDADDDVDLFDLAGFQRESGTVHTIKRPSTISPYHREYR